MFERVRELKVSTPGVFGGGLVTLALLTSFAFLVTAGATPALAQLEDANFSVRMAEQEVHGYHWEQGIDVTITIDDPLTADDPDWSDTKLALPPDWDPTMGFVQFQPFIDDIVIEPGFFVSMSQTVDATTVTKTHIVTSLEVTNVDEVNDIVSGVGNDGALIHVSVWDEIGTWRETLVEAGEWNVDFSTGVERFDITRGTQGEAFESDVDNDATQWSWRVPDPAFSVETPGSVWSANDGWVPGRTVTLTVDDNDIPGDGYLYQTTTAVESWGPSPWESGWGFDNLPFEITPGHYVTADDGVEVNKTMQVVDLTVTSVDESTDVVAGTAPPGALVEVHACEEFQCGNRSVAAVGAGVWSADFSVPGAGDHEQDVIGIQPGFGGAAQVFDGDGDSTHRGWQLHDPYFGVDVIHEEMWAVDWPAGATLTFQVFADDTETDLLWTDTMTVFGTPWQNTEAGYRFWNEFDVHGGQYFKVSDGVTTKDLVVSTIIVDAIDPVADYYTGTVDAAVPADRDRDVCAWARVSADSNDWIERCDLPDPVTGEWTIDFFGIGDIIPGDHLGAYQLDADGDETHHAWHVPPWIYVELAEQDAAGVDLYPDRVHLEQWTGPVDIYLDDAIALTGVVTNGEHALVELDVEIGQTIRVVDTIDDKSLDIELLTVDNVTAWDDPVQPSTAFGRAAVPDNTRQVQVTASADYGWWTERWVPVLSGEYQADFANPGNGWRESEIGYFGEGGADDIYLGGEVRAHLWDFDNDQVQAIWHTCNPRIIIVRGNDRIEAVCFPVGSELVVELDDPANGEGADWASGDPVVVTRNPDKPWETLVVFELGDYTAPDEATVTATATEDGVPVVVVTTEVVAFTVDDVDADSDRITGTASAGSEILVETDGNWRYPVADETNTWVADFSVPGDQPGEENPVDLVPGTGGSATLLDENGSATTVLWRISNAHFNVDPHGDWLWGHEWLPNASVDISIGGVLHSTLPTDEWGDFGDGWDRMGVDLASGMVVEVTDGETTKTHTVMPLAITDVNPDTDAIFGTATPDGSIDIWIHDTDVNRTVAVDPFGDWSVDFTADHDLVAGDNGNSNECDEDGDCTFADWRIPNAHFNVDPHGDWLWGHEWLPNASVDISIGGVLHSTLPTDEWGDFGDGWDRMGVDLASGMVVEVTDGETTKTHTVMPLAITDVNPDTDAIFGTATPDGSIDIWIHDTDVNRTVAVDPFGDWSVDFTADHDLVAGDNGNSNECDEDGDCTFADWWLPEGPSMVVTWGGTHPGLQQVDIIEGHNWPEGDEITITVVQASDPDTVLLDHVMNVGESAHAGEPTWFDPHSGMGDSFELFLDGVFDIQPGHIVSVSSADYEKALEVVLVTIDVVDLDAETVSGSTPGGQNVDVGIQTWEGEGGAGRSTGGATEWILDFATEPEPGAGTADLDLGTIVITDVWDDDGDASAINYYVPNPTFSVEHPFDVWSNQDWQFWPLGTSVEITSDVDDDPGNGNESFTRTVATESHGEAPWEVGFGTNLEPDEFAPGDFVHVTIADTTKTVYVVDLAIDNIDPDIDLVLGHVRDAGGAPLEGVQVEVGAWNEDGGAQRSVPTDATGYWQADFSVPGAEDYEQDTLDIREGTELNAQVFDEDGDNVHRGDCFDCDGYAAISIDKTASTGFGVPGDGIAASPGQAVIWTYVVTNDGEADVIDLAVSDDTVGEICLASVLAVDETLTCTFEEIAEPGWHYNNATVTATAVDADGDAITVEATDDSSYLGLDHGYITDSALCTVDGFDLVFTPDMKNWPGRYKLSANNPGQFYWNAFVRTDGDATIGLEIPYPFVTQGAIPLHAYDSVDVGGGDCFTPVGDGAVYPATFGLSDYTDTNEDGSIGYGDVYVVPVSATGGFHHLTLHLDYGLKNTNGWTGADGDAFNDPEVNPQLAGVNVIDTTHHWFGLVVDDAAVAYGAAAVTNHSEFKNVKGFGGLVLSAGGDHPVMNAQVELKDANGVWIETIATDAHGWYLSKYTHKGKTADYMLVLLDAAGADVEAQVVTVGESVKFGEANFFL